MNQTLHPLQMNRQQRRAAMVRSRKAGDYSPNKLPPDFQEMAPEIKRASELVVAVFEGTISPADAVREAHPQIRGMIPKLLFTHGATPDQVREALYPAWLEFGVRVANIEKKHDIINLFRFAEFSIPDWMPETVTV